MLATWVKTLYRRQHFHFYKHFLRRWTMKWPLAAKLFTGEKCLRMLWKMTCDRYRVMSLAKSRKWARNVVQMKEAMAAFFGIDSFAISCHCKRSKIILVNNLCSLSVFSREYSVLKLAKNRISVDVEIAGLHVEDMPKRWVIFALFVYCMFRATRYKKKL